MGTDPGSGMRRRTIPQPRVPASPPLDAPPPGSGRLSMADRSHHRGQRDLIPRVVRRPWRARLHGVASLPVRAGGWLIDGVILAPILQIIGAVFHHAWQRQAFEAAVTCLYAVPQIAIWGMTLGSRCVGVQVTNDAGRPPGWTRSLARSGTPILLALPLYPLVVTLAKFPSVRTVCVETGTRTVCGTPVGAPNPGFPLLHVLLLLLLLLAYLVVLYGPALVDSRRRALNDRVAGTVVLYRNLTS